MAYNGASLGIWTAVLVRMKKGGRRHGGRMYLFEHSLIGTRTARLGDMWMMDGGKGTMMRNKGTVC